MIIKYCKCGCGTQIPDKDNKGRTKHYVKGHSQRGKHLTSAHKANLSKARIGKYTGINNHNYGKPMTEEQKRKISEAKIGKHIGVLNHNYGKAMSEEQKLKISSSRKGKLTGTKNHNYGGLSEETKRRLSESCKGRVIDEQTRKKIGDALRGRSRPEEVKQKISKANKGKVFTEEHLLHIRAANMMESHRKHISEALMGKFVGENGLNWKGGLSFLPYSPEFNEQLKEIIRERDKRTCQLCGRTEQEEGKKLAIHHIDYKKDNCMPDNLITLCQFCNTRVNADRNNWTEYFQNKLTLTV